jgi:DNA adenine methylase
MKITAIAPWYGSNRLLAHHIGPLLTGCRWLGIPFAGGMCELTSFPLSTFPSTVLVSDLHAHVLNLAAVVAEDKLSGQLQDRLAKLPFHPTILEQAQGRCLKREVKADALWFGAESENLRKPDLSWAIDFFVCSWMGRNGTAGTKGEFTSPLSVRWNAGGGDSATRFRHAAESLGEFNRILRRCTFVRLDVFAFLNRCYDDAECGLYLDPPFIGVGDCYKFTFPDVDHGRLGSALHGFRKLRIVLRYYDHPLIRQLYPEADWKWLRLEGGKKQAHPRRLLPR